MMHEQIFRREENTSALLNVDHDGLQAYKARRDRLKKIQELETDINIIKQDMSEIKTMLEKILNRG
jgi:hypothetical protein